AADRPIARHAAPGDRVRPRAPRLSGVALQRSQAPRHGDGQRGPARAAWCRAERISHAAALGRRRFGAVPARRPRPELRLRHRRPRRRGRPRARRVRRAALRGEGSPPRLPDVAPTRAARRRSLTALRAAEDVEIEHADTDLPVDGIAERADQLRLAGVSVGIWGSVDVPAEHAVRLDDAEFGSYYTGYIV